MDDTLSFAQKEYFRNSKIRDANNELLKVYHGSGTNIKAFDPMFTGQGNDQYGSGFYFTTNKKAAKIYTTARNKDLSGKEIPKLGGEDNPTIIEAYLNIKNPIICDGYKEQDLSNILIPNYLVYDIIKRLPTLYHQMSDEIEPNPLGDYVDEFWEINPKTDRQFNQLIKKMVDCYFQDTDLHTLDILFGKYGTELRNAIHEFMGYDGVIVNYPQHHYYENEKQIVAWFPEQIKDVDNLYPQQTPLLMDEGIIQNISSVISKKSDESIADRIIQAKQKLKTMQNSNSQKMREVPKKDTFLDK